MRKLCVAFSVALVLCLKTCTAWASGPLFEETDVFVGGEDGINTYRIPAVICTKKGTLFVFCEGRRDNHDDGSPTHLVSKRSLGNSGAWQPSLPRLPGLVPGEHSKVYNLTWERIQTLLSSKGTEAFMNPVPIIDDSEVRYSCLSTGIFTSGKKRMKGRGTFRPCCSKAAMKVHPGRSPLTSRRAWDELRSAQALGFRRGTARCWLRLTQVSFTAMITGRLGRQGGR